jgi:hypothetical protein
MAGGRTGARRLSRFTFHVSGITHCGSCVAALLLLGAPCARADQVDMQNGDRYVGKVLSMSADTLVLKNEVLGTVQVPRAKVAHIRLDSGPLAGVAAPPEAAAPGAPKPAPAGGAAAAKSSSALPELGAHTNLIRQVQSQFLANAGPEANQKFDELLNGLMSGKLNVDDLRVQAQSAADQLRELKKQGGENSGLATDAYLTILDHFLKETAPSGSTTNAAAHPPAAKPKAAQAEE